MLPVVAGILGLFFNCSFYIEHILPATSATTMVLCLLNVFKAKLGLGHLFLPYRDSPPLSWGNGHTNPSLPAARTVYPHMRGADDCPTDETGAVKRFTPTCVGQIS